MGDVRPAWPPAGFLRRVAIGDLLPATGLLVLAVLMAVSKGSPSKGATLTIVAIAVLWRTRSPLLALGGVAVGALLGNLLTPDVVQCGVVLPALMLVGFSVGVHTGGRAGLSGGALALVVTAAQPFADPMLSTPDIAVLVPLVAAMWFVGRTVRSHRAMSVELERRTRELVSRREERAALAVALERARVGRELHHVVTEGVGEMVGVARAGLSSLPDDKSAARLSFAAIERSGRAVLNEMRTLLGVLRTDGGVVLAPQPRLRELEALLASVRGSGLDVEFSSHGTARELAPGVDASAYRIVEGALEAALDHGESAPVSVRVRYRARDVELEVVSARTEPRHESATEDGLLRVRERVGLYGGAVYVGTRPDGTYALRARLPIEAAHA